MAARCWSTAHFSFILKTTNYYIMKVLVAGKGFVGTGVGEKLEEEHEVKYLDRSEGDYQTDITEDFEIDEEFDVLVHTIGLAPGFNSAEAYQSVHVDGTRNLLENVKFDKMVYISALKADEVDHSFFRTKERSEELIKNSDKDYTIIRPSTIHGRNNKLLDMIRNLAPTRIFPNIQTKTQPVLLEDLVKLVAETLDSHDGETLNAGGPEKLAVGEMARRMYREEGYRCFLLPLPTVLAEWSLLGLSFLPPPFQKENRSLLYLENTTDENHIAEIVDIRNPFESE